MDELEQEVTRIAGGAGAESVAVAVHDYEHDADWTVNGQRWFHAASTIKIPVLVGVFATIEAGDLQPYSRVHVRNRFLSVADGRPFRVGAGRDANGAVHAAVGRTMRVSELAHHMIATSSNLATNLLLDLVGVEFTRRVLDRLGVHGIELRRGVEDESAWRQGINNEVTADGIRLLLRSIEEGRAVSEGASRQMLEILHAQEFRRGIPAGLPEDARVAHKTGEMSIVAHDAGLVYLPGRKPYVLVVLTQWPPERSGRSSLIAALSRRIFEYVTNGDREPSA